MKFIKDLFWGPGNGAADLGRFLAFFATFAMLGSTVYNMMLGLPIELDKAGIGYAAVLTACAAFIYAKDRAKAENVVAQKMADCAPETAPAAEPAPKATAKPKPKKRRQPRYAGVDI